MLAPDLNATISLSLVCQQADCCEKIVQWAEVHSQALQQVARLTHAARACSIHATAFMRSVKTQQW